MPGVLLPNGGSLYGEWTIDPGICGTTVAGVLLPNAGRLYGASPCPATPPIPPLPPVLQDALILLQASAFVGTDGDTWGNEGTVGSVADSSPVTPAADASGSVGPPSIVTRDLFSQSLVMFTSAIDEGDNPPSLASTPDSPALSITGDITLRVKGRGIPGWYGSASQAVLIRKAEGTDPTPGYLNGVYGLNIESDGDVRLDWTQADTTDKALPIADVFAAGYVGPYDLLFDLDVDNGAGGHTVRCWTQDDAGAVSFAGTTWTLVGSSTDGGGTTDIADSTGPLLVGITKGFFEKAQVWSGLVGGTPTLVADFDPEDSAGEGDISWDSAATGETYTLTSYAQVADADIPQFMVGGPNSNANGFEIADSAAISLGTTDATWAWWGRPFAVATVSGSFWYYVRKFTGTLGAGGTGAAIWDAKFDPASVDGFGPLISDGTDTVSALDNTDWTAAQHLVVVTFDRDGDLTQYIDGVEVASASMAAVGDLTAVADLILGQMTTMHAVQAFAQWDRLLTATEITVDLPAALL